MKKRSTRTIPYMSLVATLFVVPAFADPVDLRMAKPDPLRPKATRELTSRIGAHIEDGTGKITWEHWGKDKGGSTSASSKPPIEFRLGDGNKDGQTNYLRDQLQNSSWNIKAKFLYESPYGNHTRFNDVDNDSIRGSVTAEAKVRNKPGASRSKTGFSWTAHGIAGHGAEVDAKASKVDEAQVGGGDKSDDPFSEVSIEESYLFDGVLTFDIKSHFSAEEGASGMIDEPGLTLLAEPGKEQLVKYMFEANNYADPNQSVIWSASFDGTTLSASGVSTDYFTPVAGGFFLPAASIPGVILTMNSSFNEASCFAFVEAYDEKKSPEPATLALLAVGGMVMMRRTRR